MRKRTWPKTIAWFISKPVYWPEFVRRLWFLVIKIPQWQENRFAPPRSTSPEAYARTRLGQPKLAEIEKQHLPVWRHAISQWEQCKGKVGGGGDHNLIYTIAKSSDTSRILETGVAFGFSSLAILLGVKDVTGAKLISNDFPYVGGTGEPCFSKAVPNSLAEDSEWKIFRLPDRDFITWVLPFLKPFDLIHYDSAKGYGPRRFAYKRLWKKLRPGGILISDDIGDNLGFSHFVESLRDADYVEYVLAGDYVKSGDKFIGVVKKASLSK